MAASALTISKLAASAGVHIETVRYYQRRRLLPGQRESRLPEPGGRGFEHQSLAAERFAGGDLKRDVRMEGIGRAVGQVRRRQIALKRGQIAIDGWLGPRVTEKVGGGPGG